MPKDEIPIHPDQECPKCGEAAKFLSFIPRFGNRPAYFIFECTECKALTWITEAVTDSEPPQ